MNDKPITIALVGAAGRMGQEITRIAAGRRQLRIGAAVEGVGSPAVGRDLGDLAGIGNLGVTIVDNPETAFAAADVAVDLSLPKATAKVIDAALATDTALVCGTTGLEDSTLSLFDSAAKRIPVLYTPNLSPGVAVLSALVEQACAALGSDYDIEIVEMHHRDKVDAPSGTALALAEAAARGAQTNLAETLQVGRAGHVGKRPASEIGVHSVRGGGVFGDHTVILAGQHERIELSHMAASRSLFAEGALRAAQFLSGKKPGRYTMADVLRIAPQAAGWP
jgi:4-hydroxy-tetrahydrodipicolinate reductase